MKELEKKTRVTNKSVPVENKIEKKPKYIYISVGSIIAVIIIVLLIALNVKLAVHAYNVTKQKFNSQNKVTDVNLDFDTEDEQEFGTVLNNKNETVTKLIEKITLAPNVVASIYQSGTFDTSTIQNDLKLRIGWAKIKDENKLRAKSGNGESIIAVEKQIMQESIQKIFGTEVNYIDKSFNNTDVSAFVISSENQGTINYSNDLYTGTIVEIEEKVPLVFQEIQKVVQYDDRIIVHVKTAFVDVKDEKYIIYKEYNKGFNNVLLEVTSEELFKDTQVNKYTGEGTVTVKSDQNIINDIRDQLNTYSYTFTLDELTNEYCLSEFSS